MAAAYERRIGRRVHVEPVPVLWRVRPERRRRKKAPRGEEGALIDVSLSGLKVRAPLADDLSPGAIVPLEVEGVAGEVKVRRIVPVPGTRFADHGVEITPTSHDLADWARARLARGAELDEAAWRAMLDHSTR